ncbi:MAG: hypothetical protein WCT52_01055 [Candidatus Micrarchaeia archaeon]
MSSISLALPIAAVPARPIENRFIKKLFATLSEGPVVLLAVSASIVKKATEAYQKATNHIESGFKNFLKDPDKKKETKLVIVESTKQAAKLLLEEDKFPLDDFFIRTAMDEIQNDEGIRSISGKLIVLNMERIKQQYSGEQGQEDALILTTIHETVEKYGGFPESYGQNRIKWLDEGITEMIARVITGDLFPETKRTPATEYIHFRSLAQSICGVVGETTVHSAFFQNSPAQIFDKLRKCGISEKDISTLLKLGEALGDLLEQSSPKIGDSKQANDIVITMLSLLSKMKARTLRFDWENEPLETAADKGNALDNIVERMNFHLENIDSVDAGMKNEARTALLRLAADYVLVKYLGKEGGIYRHLSDSCKYSPAGQGAFEGKTIDLFAQAIVSLWESGAKLAKSPAGQKITPSEDHLIMLIENYLAESMAREVAGNLTGKNAEQPYFVPFQTVLEGISERVGKVALIRAFFKGDTVSIIRKLGRQGVAAGFGAEIGDEQAFCTFALLDGEPGKLKKIENRLNLDGTWLKNGRIWPESKRATSHPNGSGLDFIFEVSKQFFPAMSIEERMQLSTSIFIYLAEMPSPSEKDVYKIMTFINACSNRTDRYYVQVSLLSDMLSAFEKSTGTKLGAGEVGRLSWLASDMVYRWSVDAKKNPDLYKKFPSIVDFVADLETRLNAGGEYAKYESLVEEHWGDKNRLGTLKFFSYSLFSADAAKAWSSRIPDWNSAANEISRVFPAASKDEISEFIRTSQIYLNKNNYEDEALPCRSVQLALSCKEALEGAMLAEAMASSGNSVERKHVSITLPSYSSSIDSRFRDVILKFDPQSLAGVKSLVDSYLPQSDAPAIPAKIYSLESGADLRQVSNAVSIAVTGMECTIGESSCFLPYLPRVP